VEIQGKNGEGTDESDQTELALLAIDLTDQQLAFAERFLSTLDANRAAEGVYEGADNSPGQNILSHPSIQRYVELRLKQKHLTADMVLAQLAEIATGSIEDFIVLEDSIATPFFDLHKAKQLGKLHLIKRIKYVKSEKGVGRGGIEVELYDKIEALRMIGQALGMWREKEEQVGQYVIKVVRE